MISQRLVLSGLATAIGSMPHTDPEEACRLVQKYLPEIPVWPQLPKLPLESMYVQFRPPFLNGGSGTKTVQEIDGAVLVNFDLSGELTAEVTRALEQLYSDEIENNLERYSIGKDRAQGFYAFLSSSGKSRSLVAAKGQVIGPISFGLGVTDRNKRPLIYNEIIADAIARHLKLKAAWQERTLRAISPNTIVFLDEPFLASVGSAFVSVPREQVVTLINKVFEGVSGLKGVHCCGNTDWSALLETSLDILNFDAYNFGETLSLYPAEVKAFLGRGGMIAWGIVPTDGQALARETVSSLKDRLDETMALLCRKGIDYGTLKSGCLLTPSCGLGSLSIEAAEKALQLLSGLSKEIRAAQGVH